MKYNKLLLLVILICIFINTHSSAFDTNVPLVEYIGPEFKMRVKQRQIYGVVYNVDTPLKGIKVSQIFEGKEIGYTMTDENGVYNLVTYKIKGGTLDSNSDQIRFEIPIGFESNCNNKNRETDYKCTRNNILNNGIVNNINDYTTKGRYCLPNNVNATCRLSDVPLNCLNIYNYESQCPIDVKINFVIKKQKSNSIKEITSSFDRYIEAIKNNLIPDIERTRKNLLFIINQFFGR